MGNLIAANSILDPDRPESQDGVYIYVLSQNIFAKMISQKYFAIIRIYIHDIAKVHTANSTLDPGCALLRYGVYIYVLWQNIFAKNVLRKYSSIIRIYIHHIAKVHTPIPE